MKSSFQLCRNIGFAFLVWALTGCMVIPVPRYDTEPSRCNILEQSIEPFMPGSTTRRDIILALGEPDAVSIDERKLVYCWQQVVAWWVIVGFEGTAGAGDAGEICDTDFFVAEFDARGVLVKFAEANRFPDMVPDLARYAGHKVLFQQRALQIKPEHLGGELLLTEADLIFISDRQMANTQPELRAQYSTISDARLKWFKTTLAVRCQTGIEYQFQVPGFNGVESLQKAHSLIQTKINPGLEK